MLACLPGAIYRNADFDTVMIDPDKCINCASCAMACPFGVIRYHEDVFAPMKKVVAVKCDNCIGRQAKGLIPACVEVCKSNALTFETSAEALKRKTNEVAGTVSAEAGITAAAPGFNLLNAIKKTQNQLKAN
jgi:carbon-monoxide dehydrogenase iron sulfur subunit